jgi:hypothetical protein
LRRVKVAATYLRANGFEVYDFTEDDDNGAAFNWTDIDSEWQGWGAETFRDKLWHPTADRGFDRDFNELKACDALVLLLPCGRSAHLELGYAIGAGKPTVVVLVDGEPELMYRAVGHLALDLDEVNIYLHGRLGVPV